MKYRYSWPWYLVLGIVISLSAQTITKGPYLAAPQPGSIKIRWEVDQESKSKVYYGQKQKLKLSEKARYIGENSGHYLYEVTLANLAPGMEYQYQLKIGRKKGTLYCFKAPSDLNSICSFAVLGDSRSQPQIFSKIIQGISKSNPDFVISMGDLVENGGSDAQWDEFYFEPAGELLAERPFMSTLGDHEGDGDEGVLFKYFLFPELESEKLWYSFDYGMAHFISLDYRQAESEEMMSWFKTDVQNSKARWKIVFMHRPVYNLGGHRSFWGNPVWPDLFQKYKIDFVFGGHSHIYERFKPVYTTEKEDWAITYITTGGSGAELYQVVQHPVLAYAMSENHYINISLDSESLKLRTYGIDGNLMDSLSIFKNSDGSLSRDYLKSASLRDELDIMGVFAGPISWALESPPLFYRSANKVFTLSSRAISGPIHYELRLSDESLKNYVMAPYEGELQAGAEQTITLKINSKTDLEISGWGEIKPSLWIEAAYEKDAIKGVVQGGILELRSWEE